MTSTRRRLSRRCDLLAVAASDPQCFPALLESVADGTAHARYDILFAFPQSSLRLDADGRVRDDRGRDCGDQFLRSLDDAWRASAIAEIGREDALPFEGGWLLYLGYELATEIEPRLGRLPRPDHLPIALALRCPLAVIVDHVLDCTWLVAEPAHAHLLDALEAAVLAAAPIQCLGPRAAHVAEDDPERFIAGVQRTLDYLRAGDVFQVNLSREWRVGLEGSPSAVDVYASLRRANPSPFAGLLQWGDWAIASSSPERLVETRGRHVQTRPIAGTRARVAGEDAGERIRELIAHPKERAEHVMLIDLERNDLGRVCVPGSIEVDELMVVESYAHVHHIVSNVRGRLREDVSPGEVIRAVFPGGTITGCPKVRCMQIIAELEQCARGAYTGSLGYLGNNGDLDLNILIRTLTLHDGEVRLRAGAGIVIDSQARAELAETRAKARGLLRALGSDA